MAEGKIAYIDGLRGLAAVLVMFSHFLITFFPAIVYLSQPMVHVSNIELFLRYSPLDLLFSNSAAVPIFFVLSGYVLTYKFFRTNDFVVKKNVYLGGAIKRYPRLMIPSLFSILLVFVFMNLGLLYNLQASAITLNLDVGHYWNFTPNIFDALRQGLWDAYFSGNVNTMTYNGVLWTMGVEFTGSLLVFAFLALFGEFKYRRLLYVPLLFFFMGSFYMGFILGLLLADIYNSNDNKPYLLKNKYLILAILLFGLYLCSWNGLIWYDRLFNEFFNILIASYNRGIIYANIGACLILASLLSSEFLQYLMSIKLLQFLGKISFSLYILHPLIIYSYGCYIFTFVSPHTSYLWAFGLTFISSLAMIIAISYLSYYYIDRPSVNIAAIICNYVMKFRYIRLKFYLNYIVNIGICIISNITEKINLSGLRMR